MTDPIDIPALKAAALAAKGNRLELDVLLEMLAEPAAVLTLIERLETAEHRLMSLGYRRTCDIPACNCGDQWAHKLACPIKCSCDKCGLEKLASLLREWRAAKFFDTRERWLSWVEEFGPRVDAALASLEAAP